MSWKIAYEPQALRQLKKLASSVAGQVTRVMEERIAAHPNPKVLGSAMEGPWKGFHRFRGGDYRVICEIKDADFIILVVKVGHRKEIYNQ